MTEGEIQRECLKILKMLEAAGAPIYHTRTNSGSVKARGGYICLCRKGWPDVTCCVGERFIGIEFKSARGRQTADQKAAELAIKAAGGRYVIIRSVHSFFNFAETEWIRYFEAGLMWAVRQEYYETAGR